MGALHKYAFKFMLRARSCCCAPAKKQGRTKGNDPAIQIEKGSIMKKRISSFLFAMSIFGGVAHAETDYKAVSATLTYDEAALATEAGAAEVLADLELQAERACRKVSLVTIGLSVDEVCAEDLMYQAVDTIGHRNLSMQYADSAYFTVAPSERIQLAAR